ncbi:uncharacterized protein LOC117167507 [Belonocnema kinseyi]|uniref:uncharacterized protein LOC117167507 n=1 Tax=Belonocnema kinseyi TaxID=2817044 RepID=UPI00143DDB5C|nr:uncharacterized protein LOC117167507 [Belonocnema kinseyi]
MTFFGTLLALCVLYKVASSSAIPDEQVKIIEGLKNTTQSIIADLNRYEEKLQSDVKLKINQVKVDALGRMDGIVYYVIHGIETAVSAVNITGSDAESCHQTAKASLGKLNETAYHNFNKCVPISLSAVDPLLKNITSAIQIAGKISKNLDNILSDCSSAKQPATEKCVVLKIQDYQLSIKELQISVSKLKNAQFSAIKNAKIAARSCHAKIVYAMRVEATFKIYRDANLCIRSIYKAGF